MAEHVPGAVPAPLQTPGTAALARGLANIADLAILRLTADTAAGTGRTKDGGDCAQPRRPYEAQIKRSSCPQGAPHGRFRGSERQRLVVKEKERTYVASQPVLAKARRPSSARFANWRICIRTREGLTMGNFGSISRGPTVSNTVYDSKLEILPKFDSIYCCWTVSGSRIVFDSKNLASKVYCRTVSCLDSISALSTLLSSSNTDGPLPPRLSVFYASPPMCSLASGPSHDTR